MGFVSCQEDIQDRRDDLAVRRYHDTGSAGANTALAYCRTCGGPVYPDALTKHMARCKGKVGVDTVEFSYIRSAHLPTHQSRRQMARGARRVSGKRTSRSVSLSGRQSPQTPSSPRSPLAQPKAAVSLLTRAVTELSGPDGWATIHEVAQKLLALAPHFSAKSYGCKKLSTLFNTLTEEFETKQGKGGMLVRLAASRSRRTPATQPLELPSAAAGSHQPAVQRHYTKPELKPENFTATTLSAGVFGHRFELGFCVEDSATGELFQCRADESLPRKVMKSLAARFHSGERTTVTYRASRRDGAMIAREVAVADTREAAPW